MNAFFEALASGKAWLDAQHPAIFWLLVALLALAAVSVFRWKFPDLFAKIPPKLQALPAVIVTTLIGALPMIASSGDAKKIVIDLVMNVVNGLLAVGMHHFVKRLQDSGGASSDTGATSPKSETVSPPAPPSMPRLGAVAVVALALVCGCGSKPATAPTQDMTVSVGARSLDALIRVTGVADEACARAALVVAGDGQDAERKAKGRALAVDCGLAVRTSKTALEAVELVLRTWDETGDSRLGCTFKRVVSALLRLQELIGTVARVPSEVGEALETARVMTLAAPLDCGGGT